MSEEIKKAKECLDTIIQFDQYYLFREHANTIETVLNQAEKEHEELIKLRKFAKLFTKDRLHDGCRINNYETNSVDWGLLFRITEEEYDFYNQEADKYGEKEKN